jgi:vitamin B12 transporter
VRGAFPSRFETLQDQASWIHEFALPAGTVLAGVETLRQRLRAADAFTRTRRDTNSGFVGLNEAWQGHRLEASVRVDDDESFGRRTTGSVSYGIEDVSWGRLAATVARGFRAPTFFDLYAPSSDFYQPNPALRPERSDGREIAWRAPAGFLGGLRITAFDNRIEDLITFVFPTVENVRRARIRGVEAAVDRVWLGARWRASFTAQRPRDEDTGKRLQGRAEHFGSLEATRTFGRWTAGASVFASGDRHDSANEAPSLRLPSYAAIDARVRYRFEKFWSVEVIAANLADKRYESAVGYDAPRRSVLLNVRFDAF